MIGIYAVDLDRASVTLFPSSRRWQRSEGICSFSNSLMHSTGPANEFADSRPGRQRVDIHMIQCSCVQMIKSAAISSPESGWSSCA